MNDITILGGGLSGLTIAYLLKQKGIKARVLEARDRVGGRSYSLKSHDAVVDLGATWIWPHHHHVGQLIEQLGVETYPQYETGYSLFEMPQEVQVFQLQDSNFPKRFTHGAQEMSLKLAEKLDEGQLCLNARASKITRQDDHIEITLSNGETIKSKRLVLAIPPRVIGATMIFAPKLGESLRRAQQKTYTWMGNSAKAIITFLTPFWRERELSGFCFSEVGPLRELHDHSPNDRRHGVIKGFFADWKSFVGDPEERKASVIQQLVRLYGSEAANHIDYHDYAWWQDDLSSVVNDRVPLKNHTWYGHQEFLKGTWDDMLYFAGTETALTQGGYLDGAVESALRTVRLLA